MYLRKDNRFLKLKKSKIFKKGKQMDVYIANSCLFTKFWRYCAWQFLRKCVLWPTEDANDECRISLQTDSRDFEMQLSAKWLTLNIGANCWNLASSKMLEQIWIVLILFCSSHVNIVVICWNYSRLIPLELVIFPSNVLQCHAFPGIPLTEVGWICKADCVGGSIWSSVWLKQS